MDNVVDKLDTTGSAARILNVTPDTVRLDERSGKLPAIKTSSGQRLFRREDVEKLAAQRKARRD